jgi:predicted enzyme related to lactoylglutathione lyase
MPELDRYIPGVPCWIDTSQPDPEAAVAFYRDLFGWDVESVMPPEAPGEYFMARIRGGDVAGIGSIPEGSPPIATWNTYIWVDSADETAAKVKDAGGNVLMEPFDVMTSGRMAVVSDPEGAVFCVWEPNQHRGAQIVNEAGSVNFNNLNTRDAPSARSFYGAVFGWGTMQMGGGAEGWTLPAYGDHLERLNPGTRERMGAMGAPGGFIDVVATLVPLQDDQGDVPAHWSVTFATDDADATAEKASALGGKVLAPPFDAPWVRMTIIADPQGATFIASQFAPENRDAPAPESASSASVNA